MIRSLAVLCVLTASAYAEPTLVKVPAGWTRDDAQATSLAAKTNGVSHFGGAHSFSTADVLVGPAGSGAAIYITAVAGELKDHKDAAARVELDSFLGAPKRAQLSSPKISVVRTASALDPAKKQIEATIEWTDDDAKTATNARFLVVADADNLIAVTAECVVGSEAPPPARSACTEALATLDPKLAVDRRVALALAPEGTEPPLSVQAPKLPAPSRMSDGSRTPMPPISIPSETKRTTDRKPVYVGLGIVALAAVFWWNRRRRDQVDKESNDDDR